MRHCSSVVACIKPWVLGLAIGVSVACSEGGEGALKGTTGSAAGSAGTVEVSGQAGTGGAPQHGPLPAGSPVAGGRGTATSGTGSAAMGGRPAMGGAGAGAG